MKINLPVAGDILEIEGSPQEIAEFISTYTSSAPALDDLDLDFSDLDDILSEEEDDTQQPDGSILDALKGNEMFFLSSSRKQARTAQEIASAVLARLNVLERPSISQINKVRQHLESWALIEKIDGTEQKVAHRYYYRA